MSTAMNIGDLIDADAVGHEVNFHIHVEDRRIVARLSDSRHPEFQVSDDHWREVSGAEMWGFLRRYEIDRVLMTLSNPIRFVVLLGGEVMDSTAYFKMSWGAVGLVH
jgi:hypothetical protein